MNDCRLSFEFEVTWGDCDPAGIVFYPSYFRWFDAGSHRLMSAAGVGQRDVVAQFGVLGAALVCVQCDFRRPVTYGERLLHEVWVSEWRERSFVVSHALSVSRGIAAEGAETRVLIERNSSGGLRSIVVPQAFREALDQVAAKLRKDWLAQIR